MNKLIEITKKGNRLSCIYNTFEAGLPSLAFLAHSSPLWVWSHWRRGCHRTHPREKYAFSMIPVRAVAIAVKKIARPMNTCVGLRRRLNSMGRPGLRKDRNPNTHYKENTHIYMTLHQQTSPIRSPLHYGDHNGDSLERLQNLSV